MTQRSFSPEDQAAFAQLSGDYNPIHLDPLKARRTRFGYPVVHGVHALLWALETLVSQNSGFLKLVSLKASFNRPIGVGETVQFILKSKDETCAEIQLLTENEQAARIMVTCLPSETRDHLSFPDLCPGRGECCDRTEEQLIKASGSLDLCLDQSETARRFPHLMRTFPSSQLAELIALTRLLGMECPGLHSIFSGLNLDFSNLCNETPRLSYEVLSYDSRIRLLTLSVQAPGMMGTLRAFFRPPPQHQGGYLELSKQVQKEEFSGQSALIIGGSRGLGEVTGKLLAAGGGRVAISYCLGAEEARSIVEQINQGGGDAMCLAFDVFDPGSLSEKDFGSGWPPTHLYYFATPMVSLGLRNSFSTSMFQKYCNYYVSGFFNTFQAIQSFGDGLRGIFYPSTVAVDDLPINVAEFAAAKSAGETLCALLSKKHPGINIYSPRLPQTTTDQMPSFLPIDKQDPAPLMLESLRQFLGKGIA